MLFPRSARTTALVIVLLVLAGATASARTTAPPDAEVLFPLNTYAFTVDLAWNAVYGQVGPGETVTVTVDPPGYNTGYGAARADDTGFFWTRPYDSDRNGVPTPLIDGTLVAFYVEGSPEASFTVGDIQGAVKVLDNTVEGAMSGAATGDVVTVTLGDSGEMIATEPRTTAVVDGGGNFVADFSSSVDIGPTMMAQVDYPAAPNCTVREYLTPQEVFAIWNGTVRGYAPPLNSVGVTVYETYPTDERWSGSAFAEWPYGYYTIDAEFEPGDVVIVELPGGADLRLDTFNLEMVPDVTSDQVTGIAPTDRPIRGYVWNDVDDLYVEDRTNTGATPDYTLTMPLDLQTRHDLHVGCADAEGDEVMLVERPPHIRAYPDYWGFHAIAPRPHIPVTYTVPAYDFTSHSLCGRENNCEWASVGQYLQPGTVIHAEFPSMTMSMEIADIEASSDTAADAVVGTVDHSGFLQAASFEWHYERYPTKGWSSTARPITAGAYTLPFDSDLHHGMRNLWVDLYDTEGHKTTKVAGSPIHGTLHLQVHVPFAVSGVGPCEDEITAYLYDSDGVLLAEAEDADPDPWRFWMAAWPSNALTPGRWITVTGGSGWSTGMQIPTLTLRLDGTLAWGEAPETTSVVIEHPTAWGDGEETQFVPTIGQAYYLDIAAVGGKVDPGDSVRVFYQLPNGNRVRQEVIAGRLPRVEFNFDKGFNATMWGAADPGETVTITTATGQLTAYADPAAGGAWEAGPARIYPGDPVTITVSGDEPYQLNISIPDPLDAYASSSSDTVWGQIGGWSEDLVEIHGAWDGGYQEVTTDSEGYFEAVYDNVPEGGEGYIRFIDTVEGTDAIFHKEFTAEEISVGLISNSSVIDDDHFVWMAYQGLLRAESELGVTGVVYTSTDSSQYEPNLQRCADDGNVLCISIGFGMAEATWNVAQANPQTDFATVDMDWEEYPDNLRGMTFAADEVGYLAGTLAGMMTESDVIGDLGAFPFPPVDEFVYGYRNGAQCINPWVTTLISYTNSFYDEDLGARIAQEMMARGADVIFAPAGLSGVGAVLTATQSGAWGIGIDSDFYLTVFDEGSVAGADNLLSSAMKRIDNAVFDTIEDMVLGSFTPGTHLYDLENDGVGLAPFHEAAPYVGQDVRDQLDSVRQGIVSGRIDVDNPCTRSNVYLPLIMKR